MEKETIIDKIGRIITKIGNYLLMNIAFLVGSLPIITIGQSWCALMSAVRYQIRGDSWWEGFKFGYKTRFARVTIAWCIQLALLVITFLDVTRYVTPENYNLTRIIASGIMFSLVAMNMISFMAMNVYIPTSTENWINNSVGMVFKAPLQLLVSAGMFWGPLWLSYADSIMGLGLFYPCIMIFIAIYFVLIALATTILLKGTLIDYLIDARIHGTLIAEEGRVINKKEEDE